MTQEQVVLFVCPHGAAKSRLAAAIFNKIALGSWHAVSAGTVPQEEISEHAVRLTAGTALEDLLDMDPPRPVEAVDSPEMVVAIDCADSDLPGAIRWRLDHPTFDEAMRDEIERRVMELVGSLRNPNSQ